MIITFIIILCTIVFISVAISSVKKYGTDSIALLWWVPAMLLIITTCIIICVIPITQYVTSASKKEILQIEYTSLLLMTNKELSYEDSLDIYNRIINWNINLAKSKSLSNNIWVNWFYPNIYNDFEYIDLEKTNITIYENLR